MTHPRTALSAFFQWRPRLLWIVGISVYFAFFQSTASPRGKGTVRLNPAAVDYARALIKQGRVVLEQPRNWRSSVPSAEQENEFIKLNGFDEYAKWHLAIDDSFGEKTKSRYKFPYGDFKNVYRSALIAAGNRASQYGYSDIAQAAADLRTAIDLNRKSDR